MAEDEKRYFIHVHMGVNVAELDRKWWLTPPNARGKFIVSKNAVEADAIRESHKDARINECIASYGHNGIVGFCVCECSNQLLTYNMRKVLNLT